MKCARIVSATEGWDKTECDRGWGNLSVTWCNWVALGIIMCEVGTAGSARMAFVATLVAGTLADSGFTAFSAILRVG